MKKKLALKREALTELSPADLGRVVGADTVETRLVCYTGLTNCKVCNDYLPTRHNGCTPTPDA